MQYNNQDFSLAINNGQMALKWGGILVRGRGLKRDMHPLITAVINHMRPSEEKVSDVEYSRACCLVNKIKV